MSKAKKKLGIGIIGSGGIAQNAHMPGYAKLPEKCKIIAISDINADSAKEAAEKFNVKHVFSDYQEMLKMDEIDAISVCTPNFLHMQPTIDALKAGKDVLCEKPLARTGEEARKMVQVAKDTKRLLQVGLHYRFTSTAKFIHKYVSEGRMGDIYFARAQALRRRGIPGWGVFIDKDKQGGGPLIDIGVHILDYTLYCMGYPKAVSASGMTYQKFGKRGDVVGLMGQWDYKKFTVEDFAVGMIRFDNGATVILESSFCANISKDVFATELMGTKSGVYSVPGDPSQLKIATEDNMQLYNMEPCGLGESNQYSDEIAAFVDSILEGKPSQVPGEQGFMLNAIFDAIYKSTETGREELIDLTIK
ncbi:MAG: Gfo/Idh/MocA family oxidoreductase [bacterium]|jgi:predicted dehydrogenase